MKVTLSGNNYVYEFVLEVRLSFTWN